MNMKQYQRGFTLIELMIVVAIIGILAAFATAAYQDYTVRTRVGEGLTMSSPIKTAVAEYRLDTGNWPTSNSMAGVNTNTSYASANIQQIDVGANGVITITYSVPQIAGLTLTLTPTQATAGDPVTWVCASPGSAIENRYLPSSCRT